MLTSVIVSFMRCLISKFLFPPTHLSPCSLRECCWCHSIIIDFQIFGCWAHISQQLFAYLFFHFHMNIVNMLFSYFISYSAASPFCLMQAYYLCYLFLFTEQRSTYLNVRYSLWNLDIVCYGPVLLIKCNQLLVSNL
jgi:hypothetical protein